MTLQRRCSDPVNMGSASSDPNTNKHAAIRSHEDRVQGGGLRTTKNKHSRLGQASFIVLSSQMILSCRSVTMEPGAGHCYLSLLKRRSIHCIGSNPKGRVLFQETLSKDMPSEVSSLHWRLIAQESP